jgi:hypothetical protein
MNIANTRFVLSVVFACLLSACGKPEDVTLIRVRVLADRNVEVDGRRYSGVSEAKSAIMKIETERPDARFTLSMTNMSESEGMWFLQQLSDGDGKMGLVGILTEPKVIKN